jgi:hypothetical protein
MAAKSLGPKSYLLVLSWISRTARIYAQPTHPRLVLFMCLSFLDPHLLVPLTLLPIAPSAVVGRPSITHAFPFMGLTCH